MAGRGPLNGMRVIELAHIMAGPVCGLMLADMGADVIKVEKTDGDDARRFVPPDIGGESAAFMMMNRNKRGIVLDLKSYAGKEALHRLLRQADVVIENYRSGTMEKFGLGYDTLKQTSPGLIYCEISGFGRTGPYSDRGGFDLIAQGMSGLMSITGEAAGRPPVKVGAPISDITAGILAAMGVAAAYAEKQKTGLGQKIDTSLFEAGIVQTFWQSAIAFATGVSPGPLGSAHPLNAPYQAFQTQDGWINIGAANQRNFERLVEVLGAGDLLSDHRFADNARRMHNLPALAGLLTTKFCTRTTQAWLDAMDAAGVPAGPVLSITDMQQHPQAIARSMIVEVEHAKAGAVKSLGHPVKYSAAASFTSTAAPLLGQHTREVLLEVGLSDSDIAAMLRSGAAIQADTPR